MTSSQSTPFVLIEERKFLPSFLDDVPRETLIKGSIICAVCTAIFITLIIVFGGFPQEDRFYMEFETQPEKEDKDVWFLAVDLKKKWVYNTRDSYLFRDGRKYMMRGDGTCPFTKTDNSGDWEKFKIPRGANEAGRSENRPCTYYIHRWRRWCVEQRFILEYCQDNSKQRITEDSNLSCTGYVSHSKIKKDSSFFDLDSVCPNRDV
ncbi:hypothetical protein P9112_003130 [Eukaryota sp. TZLM1-RC]